MLAPLKPKVAAQKAEGGLQHPNGDALDVSDTYLAAGGKEIEIYLLYSPATQIRVSVEAGTGVVSEDRARLLEF